MFDYLYYDYKDSCVVLKSAASSRKIKARSLISYINTLCLEKGCSLQGVQDSFRHITGARKFIPAVLPGLILVPSSSLKDEACIWFNASRLEKIERKKKTCRLSFEDKACLELGHPKRIKRQLEMIFIYQAKINSSPGSLPCSSCAHGEGYLPPALQ